MRKGSSSGQNNILKCPNTPKRFKVAIIETLQLEVEVEASSQLEAEQLANTQWRNSEYVLGGDNFSGVDFIATLAEE